MGGRGSRLKLSKRLAVRDFALVLLAVALALLMALVACGLIAVLAAAAALCAALVSSATSSPASQALQAGHAAATLPWLWLGPTSTGACLCLWHMWGAPCPPFAMAEAAWFCLAIAVCLFAILAACGFLAIITFSVSAILSAGAVVTR